MIFFGFLMFWMFASLIFGNVVVWLLGFWIFEFANFGFLNLWIFDFNYLYLLICFFDFWIFDVLSVCIFDFLKCCFFDFLDVLNFWFYEFWISEFLNFWFFDFLHFWIYDYMQAFYGPKLCAVCLKRSWYLALPLLCRWIVINSSSVPGPNDHFPSHHIYTYIYVYILYMRLCVYVYTYTETFEEHQQLIRKIFDNIFRMASIMYSDGFEQCARAIIRAERLRKCIQNLNSARTKGRKQQHHPSL